MKNIYLLLLFFISVGWVKAQNNMVYYRMYKNVPQANNLNPALLPDSRVVIGFPGISGFGMGLGLQGIDLDGSIQETSPGSGTYQLQPEDLLRGNQDFRVNFNMEYMPVYVGVRTKNSYFSFDVMIHGRFGYVLPNDLLQFGLQGNDGLESVALEDLSVRNTAYASAGVGYGRELTEKLTVGAKIRYYQGIGDLSVTDMSGQINLSDQLLGFSNLSGTVRGAGFVGVAAEAENGEIDYADIANAILRQNNGLGITLGGSYQLTEKLNLNASIVDLGAVSWNGGLLNYQLNTGEVEFSGVSDIFGAINGDVDFLDSLTTDVAFDTLSGQRYTTPLSAQFYANADYEFFKNHHVGGILRTEFYQGNIYPALSGYYQFTWKTYVNLMVNAGYMNGTITNVGVGMGLNLVGFQFYMMSDNILIANNPLNINTVDLRFGINLLFGNINKVKNKQVLE